MTPQTDNAMLATISGRITSLHEDIGDMKVAMKDLAAAIIKLALVEERQGQTTLAQERAFKVIEKIEARLDDLEKAAPMQAKVNSWVMAVMVAIVGMVGVYVAKKVGLM